MSRFLSLLFVSLLAVSQTDAQLATKSLANDLVIATEGTIGFTELSGKPLIGTLYQQALVNIGRFDDAIAAFGPESIDARLLNRICFEMTRNGRQDAIKMLYEAQQASSTPLDEKDFSKLLAPGLKCGQLLRAVEASEFEVALALVDELKQVATTTSLHAAVRSTDEVFRELAVHSIDHGLIDQAISFVKRAKGKADVANCALSFANRDKDDAVFEFLRKLKNIDPQIAMSVASRFIGSNEKFVSRKQLPLAQSRASKARALDFIREIENDLGEIQVVTARVLRLKSKDVDSKEKNKIGRELEEFFRKAPRDKVTKYWFELTDAFSELDRMELLEEMGNHPDPQLASVPIQALVRRLVENGKIEEAKTWLNSPKLNVEAEQDILQLGIAAVKCREFELVKTYIRRLLDDVFSEAELKEAPYSAKKLFFAASESRENGKRVSCHTLPIQLKILSLIGESDFSDPQPLMLFLDELGTLASEQKWLGAEIKKFIASQPFAELFIADPQNIQCLLAIGDQIPSSLIATRDQRVFKIKIKRMIAQSMQDRGMTKQSTDFVLANFHSNRDITEAFSLDWKDSPRDILKFLYERAPNSPENMLYGIHWHIQEKRPDEAFKLAEQLVSAMLKLDPNDRNTDLMYQAVELFSADWLEQIQPLLANADNKDSQSTLAWLLVERMIKTRAIDKLIETSAFIEPSNVRINKLLEAIDEIAPRPASKLEYLVRQIKNPRHRKYAPRANRD